MSRLSIRLKLMIVFMLLFTLAFAVAFTWFYQFATRVVMTNLRESLQVSASTAAAMIDAQEHAQVYATGVEEDAQYSHIADQLRLVRDANPRIDAIYTMVHSPDNPNTEVLFVVSADENPETRAHLRSPYDVTEMWELLEGFNQPFADVLMGEDEYGVWLSGYAPIRDEQGQSVAIVGVDIEALDVLSAQAQVRNVSLFAFLVAYLGCFAATYLLSGAITKPLETITEEASRLERGDAFDPQRLERQGQGADELSRLARVFSRMAVEVQAREQKLQREVSELRIEIDEVKRAKQVADIADTDYFQDLQSRAQGMRTHRKKTD